MRRGVLWAVLVSMAPTLSMAQMAEVDTDADGMASFEELTVLYPDMTEEQFAEADTGGDGLLDGAEMTAALDAGIIGEGVEDAE